MDLRAGLSEKDYTVFHAHLALYVGGELAAKSSTVEMQPDARRHLLSVKESILNHRDIKAISSLNDDEKAARVFEVAQVRALACTVFGGDEASRWLNSGNYAEGKSPMQALADGTSPVEDVVEYLIQCGEGYAF